MEARFELREPIPEPFSASKEGRHDDDMQVVDEVRGEELPDGRGSSADADVKPLAASRAA
jgi:hypothetical protein